MNALIIEDERIAAENLIHALSSLPENIKITARLSSVRESIEYLSQKPLVDLIFSDVQLSDGLSFEIFNQESVRTPVIFVTGYDEFIVRALEYNGIDYLLKPVDRHRLHKAIAKYKMLSGHFSDHYAVHRLTQYINKREKKRMLVKKGTESILLLLNDIVLFQLEGRQVYAIDRLGQSYMVDKNLSELETELDERNFFRANRQYILNINFIRGFGSFEKVKLKVELILPEIAPFIIVSQEMAAQFRTWMQNA